MKAEQQYIDLFSQHEDLVCRKSVPAMNAVRAAAPFAPPPSQTSSVSVSPP